MGMASQIEQFDGYTDKTSNHLFFYSKERTWKFFIEGLSL